MQTLLQFDDDFRERPRGIVAIAYAMLFVAGLNMVFAALIGAHVLPFTAASWLVGLDMAQMGPVLFLLNAAADASAGVGLLRKQRWARRLTVALMAFGFLQEVPAISTAVADGRVWGVAKSGAGIIVRVVIVWYLSQEPVREWFRGGR